MAMTQTQKTDAYQFFIVAFGAVTGVEYMNQLNDAYGAGMTTKQIVNVYTTKPQFTSQYPTFLTNEQFAQKLIANVVGSSASAEAKAGAEADVIASLNAGWTRGDVIFQIFSNLAAKPHDDAEWGNTAKMFANKVAVAQYLTEVKMVNTEDLGVLSGYLANVTAESDTSSNEAIEQLVTVPGTNDTELGLGKDNIVATEAGLTFTAGLAQAGTLGNVSNTLESGDSIIAKGEGNKLVADLITTVTGGIPVGPAISATTQNVQVVELRAQTTNSDILGGVHPNFSHIDAENMAGVKEWWTVNSRSDIQIEDVRTRPEDTLIGMRNTDPEVGFRVYFDPEQLKNGTTVKNSALTLTLDKISAPGDLSNNVFNGVKFTLGGKSITLQSDAIGAATTHAELLAALEAAAANNADLAGVTFKLNANNTITLTDAAGKEFGTGSWLTPTGDIPAAGDFKWNQAVGEPERGTELISTNVELDNVGRTSAGGVLDIGSLGDGGVQKFEVNVDRSSWLTEMKSSEHLGNGPRKFLEVVNLHSKGANGNLTVGTKVATRLDGRVENGLNDVRVVDGSAFKGNLNLGITLTNDALGRYLDKATAPVEFKYTGGQGNDIINLNVADVVSEDPDFVLNVNAGAGDDRVVLAGATRLDSTSVDGGTGNNTFVVSTSVGMDAKTTFKSFANFQNYEVEGAGSSHDFTALHGVQNVVVATDAGASTTLRNLPSDIAKVSLSGKNQTIGNDNNANQAFNALNVVAAKSDTLTVSLDNTARVDGKLTLNTLNVADQNTTNLSAVRTLNVVSNGARQTSNEVTIINAEKVGTFNFSGTQALTAGIAAASNTTGPVAGVTDLKVDASALTGNFHLNLNSAVANVVDANKTVNLKGGAGAKDVLEFTAGINTTAKTTVSGFETVSFHGGQFNAVNTTDVELYKTDGATLKVTNLRGVENVELGSYNAQTLAGVNAGGAQVFQTNAVSNDSALNLTAKSAFGGAQEISTHGFTTLNLKLDSSLTQPLAQKQYDLNLEKVAVDTNGNPVVVTSGGAAAYANAAAVPTTDFTKANLTNVVVTGGSSTATTVQDSLALHTLSAGVKLVDVSGYKGVVSATLGDALKTTIGTTDYTTGNTVVKVGSFGIDFTDGDHTGGANEADTVTTFQFTADAAKNAAGDANFQWKISGFQAIHEGTGSLSNLTVLDLSALGIHGLADIQMSQAGGLGTDVVIHGNGTHNFEIVLSGVNDITKLDLANFKFAV
ncbi:hypothetical protein V8Z74_06140 [Comamonas sp. w2-DMI]|uniref:hypothetical protein n=1 Tax=Comamonas sp. w2-DMI TaxID=3126391 RepID=UPI0032E3F1D4